VELEPASGDVAAKRAQIIRPPEADMQDFVPKPGESEVDRMLRCCTKYVTGWENITEEDLLGAALASPEPVKFDLALWAEVVRDSRDWMMKVVVGLMDVVSQYEKQRSESAKN
jgi:hypothetical protein